MKLYIRHRGNQGESRRSCDIFHDEEGFSTVGVVLALLITLALIFTTAQVYEINTASAEIQEVADSTALAAENIVAEFYIVARVCDAVVLSMSLTGLLVIGVGVAALCIPATSAVSATLLKTGANILKERDSFAKKAAKSLNSLQKTLPYIAAANASAVASANKDKATGAHYFGFAILLPQEGEKIEIGAQGAADGLLKTLDDEAEDIQSAGDEADRAAQKANEAKIRGFMHDCGNDPEYCLYERAGTLANMPASDNPLYRSVDTWSFSVALKRAQAYYPARFDGEAPTNDSVAEQSNSALRKRFYQYASKKIAEGYVHESGTGGFEAYFPLLPKNTEEMKETELYTEAVYPVTDEADDKHMVHAWNGCPHAQNATGYISIADLDGGEYEICPDCEFTVSSMGKVAAASSSIANGFEYHYNEVAKAAAEYQTERDDYAPQAEKVKGLVGDLFSGIGNCLEQMASARIEVAPPGRIGAIAIVANTTAHPASLGFESSFIGDAGSLGARAAISAATLVSDKPEQGATVISSILDGIKGESDSLGIEGADFVLDAWSAVLFAYADGQHAIERGLDEMLSHIPFASASGLGKWASSEFSTAVKKLGLQPADMDAPKPAIVNSLHVLSNDDSSFSVRVISLKKAAGALSGNDVFAGAINALEREAITSIKDYDGRITIASIGFGGENSPSIPITIALPDSVKTTSIDIVNGIAGRLREIAASITGVRQWR